MQNQSLFSAFAIANMLWMSNDAFHAFQSIKSFTLTRFPLPVVVNFVCSFSWKDKVSSCKIPELTLKTNPARLNLSECSNFKSKWDFLQFQWHFKLLCRDGCCGAWACSQNATMTTTRRTFGEFEFYFTRVRAWELIKKNFESSSQCTELSTELATDWLKDEHKQLAQLARANRTDIHSRVGHFHFQHHQLN